MAEQTLSEFVMNLVNWIESLHEKNIKCEAQVAKLLKDKEELETRLAAYENSEIKSTIASVPATSVNTQIAVNTIHPQHPQPTIYQPIASAQAFVPQQVPYVWCDTNYYEYGAPAFQQPQ